MINATIIGGFLILLTISSFSPAEFPNRSLFVTIAVVIVIIFSLACFDQLNNDDKNGILFSKMGFISIILFMMFIGILNIINLVDPAIWSEIPGADKIATNNGTLSGQLYRKLWSCYKFLLLIQRDDHNLKNRGIRLQYFS